MRSYLITPPYGADRLTDLSRQEAIRRIWCFAPYAPTSRPSESWHNKSSPEMHNRLSRSSLRFQPDQHQFRYLEGREFNEGGHALPEVGAVMSSADALYRLMGLFGRPPLMLPDVELSETRWQYPLQHLPTGRFVTLLDDAGAWSLYAPFTDWEDMPRPMAADLLTLLNGLIAN